MTKVLPPNFSFDQLNPSLGALFFFLIAVSITSFVIPRLIGVIRYKNLMDHPNDRSSHLTVTPTLGGVSFFISLMIGLFFLGRIHGSETSLALVPALTILFVVGLKDDLVVLSALAKIIAQVCAVLFILLYFDALNFHGFLGLYEIPAVLSLAVVGFIFLLIINSFNLIDGIDGLASLVGVAIFSVYGILFYQLGEHYYFFLAVFCIGILLAFFRFNISKKNKIFMGDTGSMIIGFLIAFLSVKFLTLSRGQYVSLGIDPANLYYLFSAILFIPFLDVLRVMVIRISHKKSPFDPDRNHMHHIMIDSGYSHIKASVLLMVLNFLVAGIVYYLNAHSSTNFLIFTFLLISVLIIHIFFVFNPNKTAKLQKARMKQLIPKVLISVHNFMRSGVSVVFRTFL